MLFSVHVVKREGQGFFFFIGVNYPVLIIHPLTMYESGELSILNT